MKIAVCIKQVVARDWPLRVNEAANWVRDHDASFEMNEPDAYALEEALRLKDQHGLEVVVCSVGPAAASQVLREALARGADRAIHVEEDNLAVADALVVADALAGVLRSEAPDLVFAGLQSDDQGFGQTGVVLAELLGITHSTIITEVQVGDEGFGQIRVKRELESGWFQWITMPTPALLTIQSGISKLRYATLRNIIASKNKEIRRIDPVRNVGPRQVISKLYVPQKNKGTRFIEGSVGDVAKELVRVLREDARVLDLS